MLVFSHIFLSTTSLVNKDVYCVMFITHAGCIAAGVGYSAFSSVCLSVCTRSKRKRLELSTSKSVDSTWQDIGMY